MIRSAVASAIAISLLSAGAFVATATATPGARPDAARQRVIDYWTPERRAAAIPRDFVIDPQGRGYLRHADGSLVPYGGTAGDRLDSHNPAPVPLPAPGGGTDTTPPSISGLQPAEGATIGSSALFSAVITDASGIRRVRFVLTYPDGVTTQAFSPAYVGNDTWQTTIQGFSDGAWSWKAIARDAARGGGNTATSDPVHFTVETGGGGGSYIVTSAEWTGGGTVQNASGRLYFEMPNNARRKGPWTGYVCSGTVATDATTGRSLILTAAHCVYDDANKAFARNAMFIPDQASTTGSGTDLDCSNDPIGCWVPSFGAVDRNWTTRVFPDNVEWDYAFYVVGDTGAHAGAPASSDRLDVAAGSMALSFTTPYADDGDPSATSLDFTHALGYSYADDPKLMYCAEDMTTEGSVNWWLPSCDLTGGSSGGPWIQPLSGGDGPVISVNSWGYTNSPGMAGPKFAGSSTECVFGEARAADFTSVPATDGDAGVVITCP